MIRWHYLFGLGLGLYGQAAVACAEPPTDKSTESFKAVTHASPKSIAACQWIDEIDPQKHSDIQWIDVRAPDQQSGIRIPGLLALRPEQLHQQNWNLRKKIGLIGTGYDASELNLACAAIAQQKAANVYALRQGVRAWLHAKLPIEQRLNPTGASWYQVSPAFMAQAINLRQAQLWVWSERAKKIPDASVHRVISRERDLLQYIAHQKNSARWVGLIIDPQIKDAIQDWPQWMRHHPEIFSVQVDSVEDWVNFWQQKNLTARAADSSLWRPCGD
jgi:rhodanese-related sulfurtransferase